MQQPIRRNVKRFRGGLVFQAHRLVYPSILGSRVIKKKRRWSTLASSMSSLNMSTYSPSRPVTSSDVKTRPFTTIYDQSRSATCTYMHVVSDHMSTNNPITTSHVQTSRSVVSSHIKTQPFTTIYDQSQLVTTSYMHVVSGQMSTYNPITTCHVQS